MQFYYGQQMPLRILDEAEFWKHQEEEYTVVIRELMPDLEQENIDALKEWEKVLGETRQQVLRYIETVTRSGNYIPAQLHQHVLKLTSYYLQQSLDFIKLCEQIKTESETVKNNPTATVVMDHIIRESEYFVGISQALLYQQSPKYQLKNQPDYS
jgi:hypothetical protein